MQFSNNERGFGRFANYAIASAQCSLCAYKPLSDQFMIQKYIWYMKFRMIEPFHGYQPYIDNDNLDLSVIPIPTATKAVRWYMISVLTLKSQSTSKTMCKADLSSYTSPPYLF